MGENQEGVVDWYL